MRVPGHYSAAPCSYRKAEIMMDTLFPWLYWSGVAVVVYSAIAASIRYVHYWRRGHKTMAAQAVLQTVLSMFGLLALLLIHRLYQLQ